MATGAKLYNRLIMATPEWNEVSRWDYYFVTEMDNANDTLWFEVRHRSYNGHRAAREFATKQAAIAFYIQKRLEESIGT